MTQGQQEQSAVTLKRNGLTVECFFSENGRLSQKVERHDRQITKYAYQHDDKGHLTQVRRNGIVTESYLYNNFGQRIVQWSAYDGFSDNYGDLLFYDDGGRLYRAGGTLFSYDKRGALAQRRDRQGATYYSYGTDTMLDRVILPSRAEIRYEYYKSIPTCPARRFRNGYLTTELFWFDPLHLAAYRDHDNLLEYVFLYDDAGILNRVRIDRFEEENHNSGANTYCGIPTSDWLGLFAAQRRREMLHGFLSMYSLPLELLCGCDQVGTLRTLTDKSGRLVKNIVRDSFGVQQTDSFPALFMPIGFAGGLTDPETGLVRFGYRDYDPAIGRFTAPDPLGDTGGDHDLYDYCIDDPVTMNDPSGLFPPLLLYFGGKALALGIAAAGAYGSAWIADTIKSSRDGNKSSDAVDGMNRIAPKVAAASAAHALPGIAVMGPGAVTAAAQRVGVAIQTARHGDKIVKGATHAAQFVEPFLVPGPPVALSIPGGAGAVANKFMEISQEYKRKNK